METKGITENLPPRDILAYISVNIPLGISLCIYTNMHTHFR